MKKLGTHDVVTTSDPVVGVMLEELKFVEYYKVNRGDSDVYLSEDICEVDFEPIMEMCGYGNTKGILNYVENVARANGITNFYVSESFEKLYNSLIKD